MIVYVDGSCAQNGKSCGDGGFGVVVLDNDYNIVQLYSHQEENTTNNRQEMKAILWAVINYGKQDSLTIYSDSSYAINTFTKWMYGWATNNWLKADNNPPENLDLVQGYYDLIQLGYKCELIKVKAHSGNKWNEMADELAAGKIKNI